MAYIGLFSLGLFVGCVVMLGFYQAQNNFLKPGVTILGAALSVVIIIFLDQLGGVATDHKSVFMYPMGLIITVPWCHMPSIITWKNPYARCGFIVVTIIFTVAVFALVLFPQVRGLVQ